MAFNDYIQLDGFRYKTLAKAWKPVTIRSATPRMTLQGNLEGTFGVGVLLRWQGMISVRYGDAPPGSADGTMYGNYYTLLASLRKTASINFQDHYGNSYSAIANGPFEENSLVNVWNSSANKIYIVVTLTAKG